jgi:hypothetical protein
MQMLYSDWLYATCYLIVNEIASWAQAISLLRQTRRAGKRAKLARWQWHEPALTVSC